MSRRKKQGCQCKDYPFLCPNIKYQQTKSTKKQSAQVTTIYIYSVVQGSYRIGLTEYVHRSCRNQKSNSECQITSFPTSLLRASYSPVVGAVLGGPAPLRLVAMRVAGRLSLATTGLNVATRHVATGRLWAGAVATTRSSREWRARAVVAAGASGEWRVRSVAVAVTGRRGGGSVRDDYSGGLAVTKSDGGSLSGAGFRL